MSERLFPWEGAMRFGFGVLRLSPENFWQMSPRELAAAFAAFRPPADSLAPPGTHRPCTGHWICRGHSKTQ